MALIDVGPPAIDGNGTGTATYTTISRGNPANASGKINTAEVWANTNLSDFKYGMFYEDGGAGRYTCRASQTIGSVTAGSKQTFSGLDCDVQTGDLIGAYWSAGSMERQVPGSGIWAEAYDKFGVAQQLYNSYSDQDYSLYATGTSNIAPTAPTSLLCEGATNPQTITDLTPEFSAILNDPDAGDTLTHTEIYVGTSSGGSDLWSSGWIDIADVVEGNRCADISYAGSSLPLDGQKKFWKIRAKDDEGAEGAWSDVAFFRPPFIPGETLALPDAVSKSLQRRPFSESLSVTSANLRSLAKLFPEILAMADDRDFVISFVRSYVDTLALGDSAATTTALIRAFADDLDLVSDVSNAITKIMTGDVLALDDSISLATIKNLLETMPLADQVSILLALTRSLDETVAVSGQVNTQAAFIRALAEALPVADAVAKALSVAKADGFDLSDLRLLALGRELAEQLGFTESYIINTIRDIIILDSLSVSDEMSKTKMVDRILAELLGLSDRLRLGGMWDDPNIKIIASILKAAVKAEIIKAEVGTTIPKTGIQTEVR